VDETRAFSMSDFDMLESGMSYDEVVARLGRPGTLLSDNIAQIEPGIIVGSMETEVYEWQNEDGSTLRVMFGHGRLRGKSQQGLQ
jgi:hypothetical protein